MKALRIFGLVAALFCSGCLGGSPTLRVWESRMDAAGIDHQEIGGRSKSAAAWWSLLPGGGAVYNDQSGTFVALNIVLYPLLGPLWQPFASAKNAEVLNTLDAALESGYYELDPSGVVRIH